jgi:hypothetical protein
MQLCRILVKGITEPALLPSERYSFLMEYMLWVGSAADFNAVYHSTYASGAFQDDGNGPIP